MFDKHTFTCPDVIYLRKKAKKNQLIAIAIQLAFGLGLIGYGKALEIRDRKSLIEDHETPDNQE